MRRARHRDEDEEEAQDDGPQREPVGPGADALGRAARRAAAVDLDQPGQRGSADGAPGDLDRPAARRRRERRGRRCSGRLGRAVAPRAVRGSCVALAAREAAAALGGALEATRARLGVGVGRSDPLVPRGPLEATPAGAVASGAERSKRRVRGMASSSWTESRPWMKSSSGSATGAEAWRSATARAAARASRRRPRRASFSRLRSSGSRRYCTSSHHARSGWGITGVAVLFRVLTGLADGLALKELALRVGRRDSPQLWVPRFPTLSRATARFENGELSGLDGGHSNTRRPR